MAIMWQNLITVKKGDIGQNILDKHLIDMGFIPYSPDVSIAHPFDRLVAAQDKKTIFIADAKCKPARTHYPDTGINIKHFNEYLYLKNKYGIKVFLFFIDEDKAEIYGNWLSILQKEREIQHKGRKLIYPLRQKGIIYFPIEAMRRNIGKISPDEVKGLTELSSRKFCYIPKELEK